MSLIEGIPIRDSIHTDFSTGISGWEGYRTELTGEFTRQGGNVSGRYGEFSKDIQEYNRKIDTLSGAWSDTGMFLTPYNAGFRYTGTGDFNKWDTYSLDFDGVDDFIELGSQAGALRLYNSNGTISAWIKIDDVSAGDLAKRIVDKSDGGGAANGYALLVELDGSVGGFIDGGATVYSAAGTVTDATWHHVVWTWDGTYSKIYIDGSLDITAGSTARPPSDTTNMRIGSWSHSTAREFQGLMDEVAIWNSALSAVQITAIYNGGTPQSLAPYSPTAWWRMGDGPSDGNGLIGDQMNLTLGSELVLDDPYTDARWTASSGNTKTLVAGESVRFDRPASGGSWQGGVTYFILNAIGCLAENLTPNTTYEVSFLLESDDDNIGADIVGSAWAGHTYSTTGAGIKTMYLHYVSGNPYIIFFNLDNSKYVKLSGLSVKKVNGYAGGMINMTASDIVADTP